MDAAFWSGRKVFLTGHTGFKGSWLSLWLQRLGAERGRLCARSADRAEPVPIGRRRGTDDRSARRCARFARVASGSVSRASRKSCFIWRRSRWCGRRMLQPVETFATNVLGTVHLLEAVRHVESVRAVVVVTSDKCYENQEWHWGYRESEALGGHDPYSASKACAELATAAWRRSFLSSGSGRQVGVATARAGNVLGGGDWAGDRIVPDAVRAILAGKPLVVRRPQAVRPWQHVLEPLCGYLTLGRAAACRTAALVERLEFRPVG